MNTHRGGRDRGYVLSFDEPAGRIVVGYRDGVAVLCLLGEHDLATAPELSAKIVEQAEHHRGVVVSLSETEFIGSRTIGTLFRCDRMLSEQGRRLVVHIGSAAIVDRVLELSGVLDHLPWSASMDEAVSFASDEPVQSPAHSGISLPAPTSSSSLTI